MSITRIEFWKRYRAGRGALGHRFYDVELRVFRSGSNKAERINLATAPHSDSLPEDVHAFRTAAWERWRERGHDGPPPWTGSGGGDAGPSRGRRVVKKGTLRPGASWRSA